jgi:hypothetical protein
MTESPQMVDQVAEEPDWASRALRFMRNAVLLGVGISALLHIAGLILSAFIVFGSGGGSGDGQGGGNGGRGGVEVAVMTEGELSQLGGDALDSSVPLAPTAGETSGDEMVLTAAGDEAALGADPLAASGGAVGGAGDVGKGEGIGVGTGSGSGSGASFFGVEARGNRFAYIVDVSGSMGVGGKIEALRAALTESIGGLTETSSFVVLTFSSGSVALGGVDSWTEASLKGKRWARSAISELRADGGTEPLPAYEVVMRLRPRADAIYFMTDGEFDPLVVDRVLEMNRELRIPIHGICFVQKDSEESMKRLAKMTRGTYTFVKGPGQ